MKRYSGIALTALALVAATASGAETVVSKLVAKPATAATIEAQKKFLGSLPKEDGRDEKWARQGFIGTLDDPIIRRADGGIAFNTESTKFIDQGAAPPTVNPALWRHQKILRIGGLFQVSANVYQVRGVTATNPVFIRGNTGWVVIDPDMTTETGTAVKKLIDKYLGVHPVSAAIYSHSHVDHFGGIKGVLGDQEVVPVIVAPEHLVEEAGAEWVMVGNVMTRRSHFQWGLSLPRDAMELGLDEAIS